MFNNGVSLRQADERPPELTENDPGVLAAVSKGPGTAYAEGAAPDLGSCARAISADTAVGPEFFMCTRPALANIAHPHQHISLRTVASKGRTP